jgi:hypothetical protein
MIDLGSIAGLHARRHEVHAYCCRCERWRVLDLRRLIDCGKGARRLPITVRCRLCGDIGQVQIRPPMPQRSSLGWITPVTG